VELFEAGPELGGRIAPARLGEREVALGGKNVGRAYTEFRSLLARRGYDDYEFFGPDAAQVVRGRVRAVSFRSPSVRARMGMRLFFRGQIAGGVRFLRLAKQVRAEERSRYLGDPWFAALAAEKGDPSASEYLGKALTDVLRFITVRMNGAEPDEVHLGNLGSNLALVVDRFDQLSDPGLGPFLRDVAAEHALHLATPVEGLVTRDGRVAGVVAAGEERDGFDAVALAVPAPAAAAIVEGQDAELAGLLRTIDYFPVGVVVAEYDRPVFERDFAGLATASGIALSNAGAYGLDDRNVVRFTFSGRAARERVAGGAFDPEALLAEAESFLSPYLPLDGAKRLGFTARAFDPGLCAYRRDHAGFLAAANERLAPQPGLALAGDYMRGASLEACVRSALDCVERVVG
jgi:oxygen-dependent protoporphyrinogen oxidase